MFENIHHVAFSIRDIDAGRTQLEGLFDLDLAYTQTITDRFNLELAIYFAGDNLLELIAPHSPEGWTHDYIEEHGEGLFHIAFEVENVRERMADLRARGVEFEDGDPRPGPDDAWEVATIEDDTLVMMQIVEQAEPLREALGVE